MNMIFNFYVHTTKDPVLSVGTDPKILTFYCKCQYLNFRFLRWIFDAVILERRNDKQIMHKLSKVFKEYESGWFDLLIQFP